MCSHEGAKAIWSSSFTASDCPALWRGQTGPTSHLPLLSLKHQHKSQGQADSNQRGKQHSYPLAAQDKHLAGGVDVGPHHHIEHLERHRKARSCQGQELHSWVPLWVPPAPTGQTASQGQGGFTSTLGLSSCSLLMKRTMTTGCNRPSRDVFYRHLCLSIRLSGC